MSMDPPLPDPPHPKKLKMSTTTTTDEETEPTPTPTTKPRFKRRKIAIFLAYCGLGYQGMQRNPGAKTIESDLEEALFKSGAISETDHGDPRKIDWARSARTDKGVSAVGQVVSGRFFIDPPGLLDRLNSNLPAQIRAFGFKRVTASFSAKKLCDRRRYIYLLPVFALDPNAHPNRESVLASLGSGNELVKCLECSERGRKVEGVMGRRNERRIGVDNDGGRLDFEQVGNGENAGSCNNGSCTVVESIGERDLQFCKVGFKEFELSVEEPKVGMSIVLDVPKPEIISGNESDVVESVGERDSQFCKVGFKEFEQLVEEPMVGMCVVLDVAKPEIISENESDAVESVGERDSQFCKVGFKEFEQLVEEPNVGTSVVLDVPKPEIISENESDVRCMDNSDTKEKEEHDGTSVSGIEFQVTGCNGNASVEKMGTKKCGFCYGEKEKERFNNILKQYVGTHNFHNFTTRIKAEDPSVVRYILSFEANDVISIEGADFIKCEVVGQSFVLHQIRKMIGFAVAVMRNCAPDSLMATALKKDVNVNVPTAPELGLFLAECIYTSYNQKWRDSHEELSLKEYADQVEDFTLKHIYSHIASTEHKEGVMALWLHSVNHRNYPDFHFVEEKEGHKGVECD